MRSLRVLLVLALLLFTARTLVLAGSRQLESDTLWHIKAGEYMLDQGLVKTDPFSWTMRGTPWFSHEWLWEVLAAAIYGLGGSTGVWAFNSAWIALFCLVLFVLVRQRCSLACTARIYVLVVLSSSIVWTARPHVMALGLFALWMYLILTSIASRRHALLYGLPFIAVVWANVHGSAPLGPALAAAVWLVSSFSFKNEALMGTGGTQEWRKHLAVATALSAGASLVNPQGWRLWWYIAAASQNALITTFIEEWQSPDFSEMRFWPILLGAVVLVLLLVVRRGRVAVPVLEGLLTLGFFLLCIRQARHVPYFYFFAALLIGSLTGSQETREERGLSPLTKAALVIITAAFLVLTVRLDPPGWIVRPDGTSDYPVEAVQRIKAMNPPVMRLFNDYYWGGYLIWEGVSPFIDGRADMYVFNGDVFNDYMGATLAGQDQRASLGLDKDRGYYLDKYSVDTILIGCDSSLEWFLRGDSRWQESYRDAKAVIFTRKGN